MARDPEKDGRCLRFKELRERLRITGVEYSERLNDAAEALGFARYWTPPKVSNTEGASRDVQYADLAVLEVIDPEQRGWFWFAFGRDRPAAKAVVRSGAPHSGTSTRRATQPHIPVPKRVGGKG